MVFEGISLFLVNFAVFLKTYVFFPAITIALVMFTIASLINILTAIASLKREKKYKQISPKVSVIVRTWNDGEVVERCINNLLKQDYPKNKFEIIIADDGSTDKTKKICEQYHESGKIRYVRLPNHLELKSDVIDPIIKELATGEIIVETDVDFVLPKNWISEMIGPFSDDSVKAVTGRVMCGNWYRTWLSHIRAVEDFWHFCTAMYGRFVLTGQGTLYGSSKAYRKSIWAELGGHPKNIVEDAAFMSKLIEHGHKIVNIKIENLGEEVETFKQYYAERKRWAGGNIGVFGEYNKSLFKNIIFYIVMVSNFSVDALFIFSIVLMLIERLFFIPIFITLLSFWIGLWACKARDEFYIWSAFYVVIGPILQAIAVFGAAKDKLIKGKLVWEKVRHYPTELKMPTK